MGLYIAIWIALLVLATARREHRLLLWTVVVGMSLLAGLRDLSIGVDTRPYHERSPLPKMAECHLWSQDGACST